MHDKRDIKSSMCVHPSVSTAQAFRFRFWDVLAAIGILLSLQTQLRPGGAVVGPGELLLVAWIIPTFLYEICRFKRRVPRAFWDLTRFWGVFAIAESVGAYSSIANGTLIDWSLSFHDVAAYLLLFAFSSSLTFSPNSFQRARNIQWVTMLLGSALILLQLAHAFGLISIRGIDPWYWDRLRGWSDNPNQLALEGLLLGFLSISCAEQSSQPPKTFVAIICACIAFGAGALAKSNTFTVVVFGGLLLFAALKVARKATTFERKGIPAFSALVATCALVGLSVCVFYPFLKQDAAGITSIETAMARDNRQETHQELLLRLFLWQSAIHRGTDAHMLGLGPGPHLEIPFTVLYGRRSGDGPANVPHPKLGLAPNFEAHNSTLELFVQGGLLAAGAFLTICIVALWRAYRAGLDGLTTMLLTTGAFGCFHVITRHPVVWFIISLALLTPRNQTALVAAALPRRFFIRGSGHKAMQPSRPLA